jgi:site-specific recombinase XerD
MMKNNDFAYHLSNFFQKYLPGVRNVSENTIYSYRDTFTKLLTYFRDKESITPEKIHFSSFSRSIIEDFLFYLENDLNCSISTRNQRLAAIKSFFRYVQVERPDQLILCQSILIIKNKKTQKPVIEYLTGDEIKRLLEQPDKATRNGRRDLALLSLMYDSAARVQEICDLTVKSLRLASPPTVHLYGKGRKLREIPLSAPCTDIIFKYIEENHLSRPEMQNEPLFTNNQKRKLSRSGIAYILSKYIFKANENNEEKIAERITPHCLRHSKAMHMVEAGINLIYIRDFLGHESIETTQVYAKANPEAKRKAIEKMASLNPSPTLPDWNDNPDLMDFLRKL